jgi:D-beta-D-heptose 7-phosphate kinase/D-beta-D-heptose 1-phosphate adenosyltransferase
VIVATGDLGRLAGSVTMVSGGFDPLHPGHLAYFRAAAELGAPLLVNVSHDEWVGRKHVPFLTQEERIQLIDALEMVDYVHAEQGRTSEVVRLLRPRYFAKGADWQGRLPDDELEVCREHGVEIVFLDTVVDSSTDVLRRFRERLDSWGQAEA